MKKVKIIATAAALAVGGYLALESAAQAEFSLTVHGFSSDGHRAGAWVSFDEMSSAEDMSCGLHSQVDNRFGCPLDAN